MTLEEMCQLFDKIIANPAFAKHRDQLIGEKEKARKAVEEGISPDYIVSSFFDSVRRELQRRIELN